MQFSNRQLIAAWLRRKLISFRSNVSFGSNVYIGRNCSITGIYKLEFGSDVYVGKNVTIEVEGRIGSKVLIANNVGLIGRRDHAVPDNSIAFFDSAGVRADRALSIPLVIEDNVWIGFGAVVLSGVRVGEGSIIAAGSIVVRDVPARTVVSGNPAMVSRRLDQS